MREPVVIAYDAGTSGVKAVVGTADGTVVAARSRGYPLHAGPGGAAEQSIDEIRAAIAATTRDLIDDGRLDPRSVEAIGITAQMFNIVPVDRAGEPLAPMMSWLDQRSAGEADALARRVPPDEQFDRFDAVLTGKDLVPRILWTVQQRPEAMRRTAWYLDCKEALVLGLTGRAVADVASASAYRLLDRATTAWSPDRCAAAGIDAATLPEVGRATECAGPMLAGPARSLGLRSGTPVAVGTGDVPASQLGSGAIADGDTHLSLGTAFYLGISLDRQLRDPSRRLGVIGHVAPDRSILWLETATGGGALAWLSQLLAGPTGAGPVANGKRHLVGIEREVDACAGETDDLLFAPWLSGERVPVFDDGIRGAVIGLGLHHGRGHLVRAAMEGVAYQVRWAFEYGLAFGVTPGMIRAVGGAGVSSTWLQIIADVLGRPVEVVRDPEHAAARATLMLAAAVFDHGLREPRVTIDRTVLPDPARHARYEVSFERFRRLYEALAPLHQQAPGALS